MAYVTRRCEGERGVGGTGDGLRGRGSTSSGTELAARGWRERTTAKGDVARTLEAIVKEGLS
jgi:hypothetical protein